MNEEDNTEDIEEVEDDTVEPDSSDLVEENSTLPYDNPQNSSAQRNISDLSNHFINKVGNSKAPEDSKPSENSKTSENPPTQNNNGNNLHQSPKVDMPIKQGNSADASRLQQALNKKNLLPNLSRQESEDSEEEQGIGKKLEKTGEAVTKQVGGKVITAATGGAVSGPAADAIANVAAKPVGKLFKYAVISSLIIPILILLLIIVPILLYVSHDSEASSLNGEEQQNKNFCSGTTIVADDLKGLNQDQVVEILGPIAQSLYMKTGVLASVTLAQMLEESGCGQVHDGEYSCSSIAHKANNLFGMKTGYHFSRGGWDGTSFYLASDGSKYRKYTSVNDSLLDRVILLADGSSYKNVTKKTTPKGQLQEIQKGGYCQTLDGLPCPGYIDRNMNLINAHNLTKWDVKSSSLDASVCTTENTGNWKIRTIAPTKSDLAFDYLKKRNVGQCVWYAQGRAVEIIQELMKNNKLDSKTGNEAISRLGRIQANAEGWYRKSKGLFKGSSNYKDVKAGSIISWTGGSTMCSPRCGHVAVVESVTDQEVIVTDGWANGGSSCPGNWSCVRFRTQTMSKSQFESWVQTEGVSGAREGKKFSGYIYFLELDG